MRIDDGFQLETSIMDPRSKSRNNSDTSQSSASLNLKQRHTARNLLGWMRRVNNHSVLGGFVCDQIGVVVARARP